MNVKPKVKTPPRVGGNGDAGTTADRWLVIRCAWVARYNASRATDRDERRHWNAVAAALSASGNVHQARARLVGPEPHSAPRVAFLDRVAEAVQADEQQRAQRKPKATTKAAPSAARERNRGVPAAAPAVWAYRQTHPRASVPETAEAVGCSEQTVRRALQAQRAA